MATYKGIQGYSVQKLSSDPTASEAEGQLWYNSASGKFKISTAGAGAWSSGGALTTARDLLGGGAGIQTAAMVASGRTPTETANTETYNGTAWTEVNNLNEAKSWGASFGATNTAAIYAGGHTPPPAFTVNAESWDGTSWTEDANINTAREGAASNGSQTSGLMYGGDNTPVLDIVESWNGTSWAETADLNTARTGAGGAGSSNTSALAFGGEPTTGVTESWNGTSWTEVNNLNTARQRPIPAGTQTAALAAGGDPPGVALTEKWDGTSWTEVADLATARGGGGTAHSAPSGVALVTGGRQTSAMQTATEEWNDPVYTIKTVTVS